jgi:hypothetical protein
MVREMKSFEVICTVLHQMESRKIREGSQAYSRCFEHAHTCTMDYIHTHAQHAPLFQRREEERGGEEREETSVRGCVRERQREKRAERDSGDPGGTIDIASMKTMEHRALPLHV